MTPSLDTRVRARDATDPLAFAVFAVAQLGMVVANLGRIPAFSTGSRDAPILINELLLSVVVGTGLLVALQRRALSLDHVALRAAAFAAIGAGSALWSMHSYGLSTAEVAISLAYLARWVAYALLYVALTNTVDRGRAVDLWRCVEAMLLMMAVFGILQAAFLPNFAQLVYSNTAGVSEWDVQGNRLVSTILEPNIMASMLTIGLLIQLAMVSTGATVQRWKAVVLFAALCMTLSRGALLSFAIGVVVLVAIRGLSRRLVRFALFGSLLLIPALPKLYQFALLYGRLSIGSGTSAGLRIASWLQAITLFRDHPLFGVGFNTYGFVSERYGIDRLAASSYSTDGGLLFIAATTGIIGVIVYCSMLASIGRNARRVWRDPSRDAAQRGLAIGVVAATVAVVFQSIFVNAILTTFVMEILWVLWASVAILGRVTVEAPAVAPQRLVALRA